MSIVLEPITLKGDGFFYCIQLFSYLVIFIHKRGLMDVSDWIAKNNTELIELVKNIVKKEDEYLELYQHVVLQLLEKPEKMNKIPDEEKLYFFIKVIKNNWHSKTSPYHYQRRKHNNQHIELKDYHTSTLTNEEYTEDIPDIEWVKTQLETMSWFERDLWIFYFENKTFIEVHRKTNIPINSVSRYIKNINEELINRYKKEKK